MTAFLPAAAGATGMVFVGGSVAVSGVLADAPLFTVQSLRYAVACLLLLGYARLLRARASRTGRPPAQPALPAAQRPRRAAPSPGPTAPAAPPSQPAVPSLQAAPAAPPPGRLVLPRGTEWLWLLGVTATGLLLFNVALVQGAKHAEPAVLGVAVACVPILLALIGPLLEGHPPAARVVAAAAVVTLGAGLVQGVGRADGAGLAWAAVTFACEAGFTLMAVPLLGRHGALGVSVHTTWLAAVLFGMLGLVREGPAAVTRLTAGHLLAAAYLAVLVTAVAFVLWYTCVARLGAGRAGLLTGVAPVAAAITGVALGGPVPRPLVWAGVATVAAGLALGLRAGRPAAEPVRSDGPVPVPA